MSVESHAYDNEHGDPVVVLVYTGTYDVSRLMYRLSGGAVRSEDIALAEKVRRQVSRHNSGKAALKVLAAHGGPDLTKPEPVYLVWSNEHRAWWGPNRSGYTGDVWSAGRYSEDQAAYACSRRSWPEGAPPPEVMVLAPEHGQFALSVDEIRAVPEVMRARIAEATRKAVAEREPVPTA